MTAFSYARKLMKTLALILALFCISYNTFATTLEFPIGFSTKYLTRLLKETVFKDSEALSIWGDESGCNDLVLLNPVVIIEDNKPYVLADVKALTGWVIGERCITLIDWQGKVKALQRADVIDSRGLISFSTLDTELLDSQGNRALVSNTIWNLAKENVHIPLDKLSIDLIAAVDEIRELLPLFLANGVLGSTKKVVNSLHIERLSVEPQQVSAMVSFDIDTVRREVKPLPQKQLSTIELEQFEETWERWDAFLGFIIKIAGRNTLTSDQVNLLLETLIDTRYLLVDVLTSRDSSNADPIRENFIQVWQQLAPVFRKVSTDVKGRESLYFLSFIAAADALEALDKIGPVTGWDITVDGLRRLARLLIDDPGIDPLKIDQKADPELRQIFNFGPALELPPAQGIPTRDEPLINWLNMISPTVLANIESDQDIVDLDKTVPNRDNIDRYLFRVKELLRNTSYGTLMVNPLQRQYHRLFHHMIFTTAWQETCWRQYKLRRGRLRPVTSSAGALGMMQIMPIVWRGFYDSDSLGNSIEYNAAAGGEILHRYLVRYAIRKGEHKRKGGLDNLARATYAAYNGGPRHLNRYRKADTSDSLKKIDAAFWDKFVKIREGNTLAVKQCYPYE